MIRFEMEERRPWNRLEKELHFWVVIPKENFIPQEVDLHSLVYRLKQFQHQRYLPASSILFVISQMLKNLEGEE
jgi:hypothetical protein